MRGPHGMLQVGLDHGNTPFSTGEWLELVEMPLGLRAGPLRFFSLVACWT